MFKTIKRLKLLLIYIFSNQTVVTDLQIIDQSSDYTSTNKHNKNTTVSFKVFSKESKYSTKFNKFIGKKRKVWIVAHGFRDSIAKEGVFFDICNALVAKYPQDFVIGINWQNLAAGKSVIKSLDVHRSATWVGPIARSVFDKLQMWGLSHGSDLNLIGHSLGSLLVSEIARTCLETTGVKAGNLIAIEPPSEQLSPLYQNGNSKYLTQLNPRVNRVNSFQDVCTNSLAVIANGSGAVSLDFAKTAQELEIVKFEHPLSFIKGHYWVLEYFAKNINKYI
jgi:Lipase